MFGCWDVNCFEVGNDLVADYSDSLLGMYKKLIRGEFVLGLCFYI